MPSQIPYYRPSGVGNSIADLLQRQGDIRGQQSMAQAALWGNAINNIGQIVGGAIQQRQEEKQQKRREAMFSEALQSWDPQDPRGSIMRLARVTGPDDAMKFGAGLLSLESAMKKNAEGLIPSVEEVKGAVVAAHVLSKNSPAMFAQQYPNLRAQFGGAFKQHFGYDLPEALTSEVEQGLGALAEQWGGKTEKLYPVKTGNVQKLATEEELRSGLPLETPPPTKPEKTLAEIEAEAAARARGSRRGAPPEGPQGTWTQVEDAEGNPVLLNTATSEVKPYPEGVRPKPGQTEANRMAASISALSASKEARDYIKANKHVLGAVVGRYQSLAAAAGAGDPTATRLIGMLTSYSSLQPQIHGFRSAQFVDKIEKLINIRQSPEALIAGIEGIDTAARAVSARGRESTTADSNAPPAPEKKGVIYNPKTRKLEPEP